MTVGSDEGHGSCEPFLFASVSFFMFPTSSLENTEAKTAGDGLRKMGIGGGEGSHSGRMAQSKLSQRGFEILERLARSVMRTFDEGGASDNRNHG